MSKISALTEGTSIVATDLFRFVDVSDTTMAGTGTNKKATAANVSAGLLALSNLYYASNVVYQRNGANAQEFRLYNTYDGTNDEWGFLKWDTNVLKIATAASGTGTLRDLMLGAANLGGGNVQGGRIYFGANNYVYEQYGMIFFDSSGNGFGFNRRTIHSGYIQIGNQSTPSQDHTSAVRIYAEDNGAGKTRLMALFPTGAAQQIAIEP